MTPEDLRHLFRFDQWANAETMKSLQAAGTPPPKAVRFMAHVIAAEQLWLGRIRQDGVKVPVWPTLTLEECGAQLTAIAAAWASYVAGVTPAELERKVGYVNSAGEAWANSVAAILTHVTFHSTHHRGQIASLLRDAGHQPAYTDYMHGVRQGWIK